MVNGELRMVNEFVKFEVEDGIGIIRVNKPERLNALDWAMQEQFAEIVAGLPKLKALIITGTGRMFVSGGDLNDQIGRTDPTTGRQLTAIMHTPLAQLAYLPFPTIAAINGSAYGGGCEIITACDLRIMSSSTSLHFVQAKMGLTTGWGGTARLVRLIGVSRAMQLLLTTEGISAETAQQFGLVHRVVEGDVLSAAIEWAHEMGRLPRSAIAELKRLVYLSAELSLEDAYSAEIEAFVRQWTHPDHLAAVEKFAARRQRKRND